MRCFLPMLSATLYLPLLVGCSSMPASLVPLDADAAAIIEHTPEGEWELTTATPESDRRAIISFRTLDDVFVTISRTAASHYSLSIHDEDTVVPFECAFCKIGDGIFIDLRRTPIRDAAIAGTTLRPHYFAKCTFATDSIRLTGCNEQQFKAILEEESLPYTISDSAVVYTGSSTQLRELIRSRSDELFPVSRGDVVLRNRKDAG